MSIKRSSVRGSASVKFVILLLLLAGLGIAWTTAAEIQLVLLGLLTIVRVAAGPEPFMPAAFLNGPVLFGNFLVAYLCLILIFLSGLHMRVWVNEAPFRHAG